MQATQFIHDERLHGSAAGLGHPRGYGVGDGVQGVFSWARHHRVDGLLDQIGVGQSQRSAGVKFIGCLGWFALTVG